MEHIIFRTIVIFITMSICQRLGAQDLIENQCFTIHKECTRVRDNIGFTKSWFGANRGSSDICNKSCNGVAYAPRNINGEQYPLCGDGYAGIVLKARNLDWHWDYQEYLQTKLLQKLNPNQKYCLKFYMSLADIEHYAAENVEALLPARRKRSFSKSMLTDENAFAMHYAGGILSDKDNWMEVSKIYTATGGEKYLTIGRFSHVPYYKVPVEKKYAKKRNQSNSYYYVDNVTLVPIEDSSECPCYHFMHKKHLLLDPAPMAEDYKSSKHDTVINSLNNVFFESSKSELLPQSVKELDQLYYLMLNSPQATITIAGHTDSVGKAEANQALSEARAKAVADYIVGKGIDRGRCSFIGYGSRKPIDTNDTEEGRSRNRRVEFVLFEE